MAELLLGKQIKDIQDTFIKRKYGWSGVVIGATILFFFVIGFGVSLFVSIGLVKNSFFPEKTLGVSVSPSPTPPIKNITTPTPIDSCSSNSFIAEQWDTSQYELDDENYYLPKIDSSRKFLFPPMRYKERIPADFKGINLVYESTFQNKQSTSSATLFIALYDDKKNVVFTFDIPQPNRQLIGRKVMGDRSETDPKITPETMPPVKLPKKIPLFGTNEITINPIVNFKNNITYVLSGYYTDIDNHPQPIYIETPVQLKTVNPSINEFSFVIGTGRQGKLKIKKFAICS